MDSESSAADPALTIFLGSIANQQADLLLAFSLQLEEVIRRSLLQNGEIDVLPPADDLKQEARDAYQFPVPATVADRLVALKIELDGLLATKMDLEEQVNDYNHHVAVQAQTAENNQDHLDDVKQNFERSLTRNSHNEGIEARLRELVMLNDEIQGVEAEIAAQENAVKDHWEEDFTVPEVECLVCFEKAKKTVIPKLCQHTICTTCTHTYIFNTKQMKLPAACPAEVNCAGQLDLEHLSDHLPAEDLEKLHRRALETELIDSGRALYCSNPRCGEIVEVTDDADIRVECVSCQTRMCRSCKVAWHTGFTCETYQALPEAERNEADLTLLNLARAEAWKRCPRCGAMISLVQGCNHIRCPCSHEFCYICSVEWKKDTQCCPTRCPLWDENMLVDTPIVNDPGADRPFIPAAVAYLPPHGMNRLPNPPRGIDLTVFFHGNRCRGPLRRSLANLQCMYCLRRFANMPALNHHYNFTERHAVWDCCGRVFLTAP